ncbi:MAG TPA: hypothetical protein VJU84_19045 [Pyrinomonadaceae bacterium]|nr:hypothetical protein [Pyrinomonadaceae bacterium]
MRGFFLAVLILFLATVANGQPQKAKLKEHPTLKIVKFQWLASGGNSFPIGWNDGSSNGGIFPTVSNWGVAPARNTGGLPGSGRGTPFYCRAVMTLKNAGSKTIRAVYLDYIFRDQATGEEFLRYQFRAHQRIHSGQTKELRHDIYEKGGKHRKSLLPTKPSLDVVLKTQDAPTELVIRRIEYIDGTSSQL